MQDIKSDQQGKEAKSAQIIRIEQDQLTRHLDRVVRVTVEQTLNALLDAEADRLCQAGKYERSTFRKDTPRALQKKAFHPSRRSHPEGPKASHIAL